MAIDLEYTRFTSAKRPQSLISTIRFFIVNWFKRPGKVSSDVDPYPFDEGKKAQLVQRLAPNAATIAILRFGTCYVSTSQVTEAMIVQELTSLPKFKEGTPTADFEVARIEVPFFAYIVRNHYKNLINIYTDADFLDVSKSVIGVIGRTECSRDLSHPKIVFYCNPQQIDQEN